MVLWKIDLLWKTMVLWKNLWYYTENYGSKPKNMELSFLKEINLVDHQETLIYNGKSMVKYHNN